MRIQLIQVPYDSGHRSLRMGGGPVRFAEGGAAERLRARGHEVSESVVEVGITDPPAFPTEIATSFALHRAVAEQVRAAAGEGALPVVLAGNCGSALGTMSALAAADPDDSTGTGVIWLDAHADFNTPETTTSGFLDGMALAALTGRCWRSLTASIPGFRPVPDTDVVLIGARDLDAAEEAALSASGVARVEAARMRAEGARAALDDALTALARRVSRVYLHVDLDVHDPAEARANQYAAPGGLPAGAVRDLVRVVAERFSIAATALTAYDPSYDPDGSMFEIGVELMGAVAEAGYLSASGRRPPIPDIVR
jgi:arginase